MTQQTQPAATADATAVPAFKPLPQPELDKVRLLITKAKAKLVLQQPFYAALLLRRPLIETYSVPTAGADSKGRIYYNPHFVASKHVGDVNKLVFLLAHEVMHIAFHHCHKSTMGDRDQRACNIAMDKVSNELLIKDGVGEFIEGGQRHTGAENMKWQDLYQEPDPNGDGTGPGGPGDDLIPCPDGEPTPAEAAQLRQAAAVELAQAAQAARMQGKLSANVERLVEDLLYVKTPWHTILERFMQAFNNSDYSWKRPNRRFVGQRIYLPGLDKLPSMGKVGIIGDTSGSIGAKEVAVFQAHVNRIIESCRPEEVILLSVDSQVAGVQRFTPDEFPIKWEAKGGGGTDMGEGWRWFEENEHDVDCIICLTDGYTPWPDTVCAPSIVLSTTEQVAPSHVGETVFFDAEA